MLVPLLECLAGFCVAFLEAHEAVVAWRGGGVCFHFFSFFLLAFGGYRNGRRSVANKKKALLRGVKNLFLRMAAVFGSRGFRMWPFEGWGCPFPFGAGHKKNARFVVNGH